MWCRMNCTVSLLDTIMSVLSLLFSCICLSCQYAMDPPDKQELKMILNADVWFHVVIIWHNSCNPVLLSNKLFFIHYYYDVAKIFKIWIACFLNCLDKIFWCWGIMNKNFLRMYGLNLNSENVKLLRVELYKCQSFKWFHFFFAFHERIFVSCISTLRVWTRLASPTGGCGILFCGLDVYCAVCNRPNCS
jgi:hypothetical protein